MGAVKKPSWANMPLEVEKVANHGLHACASSFWWFVPLPRCLLCLERSHGAPRVREHTARVCRLLLLSLTRAGPGLSLSLPEIIPAPPRASGQRVAGAEQGGEGTLWSTGCWLCCFWAALNKTRTVPSPPAGEVQTVSPLCWTGPFRPLLGDTPVPGLQ